jgi:hypothetical protein
MVVAHRSFRQVLYYLKKRVDIIDDAKMRVKDFAFFTNEHGERSAGFTQELVDCEGLVLHDGKLVGSIFSQLFDLHRGSPDGDAEHFDLVTKISFSNPRKELAKEWRLLIAQGAVGPQDLDEKHLTLNISEVKGRPADPEVFLVVFGNRGRQLEGRQNSIFLGQARTSRLTRRAN